MVGDGRGLFRKSDEVDLRKSSARSRSLEGGGYTSSRNKSERGKMIAIFLGGPLLFFAVVGVLGWLLIGGMQTPLNSSCGDDGFIAQYNRADFHREAAIAWVDVRFNDEDGNRQSNEATMTLVGTATEASVVHLRVAAPPGFTPVACEVTRIRVG